MLQIKITIKNFYKEFTIKENHHLKKNNFLFRKFPCL